MQIQLSALENTRILVVGDVMLDRYWQGSTSRISPEAPVPVVKVGQIHDRPGGAANVALNIAALGAQVHLLGIAGQDEHGHLLQHALEQAGVHTHLYLSPQHPTITKLRVTSRNQQLIRLDFEESFADLKSAPLQEKFAAQLDQVDLVIFSDYGKGTLAHIQPLIQQARARDLPVLVDPKGQDFTPYQGATLITPNVHEFETIVGPCAQERDLAERGEALRCQLNLDALLITRSEKGMTLVQAEAAPLHLPTHAREVYDVTGAGDTVIATLGLGLAAGYNLAEAMALANLAAGLVVAKPGTATLSLAELYAALHADGLNESGVLEETTLLQAVQAAKARGERLVMTNGCFDILHAGHVAYLERARKLGDRLIVAVNTDTSVRALKGPQRPVNPCNRRMQVLAALQAVDWVVAFDEETPARLISAVLPHVLVKGGDYQVEQIAGAPAVLAAGGQVQVLDFEDGCSTTAIINTLIDTHTKG
ncbi:D-beta-D-heptose 7-phosphate kinase / D-beta-D-heptose 1-phosphate adenosyltransferase [Allopseudospirillum japonicum]|uniref:Bifunctional protein HldE n=1 Tax=Allopseudospirillum japonicum TaxID=64971 RepID=A0A1H6UCR7_9GAMM|nr:bifunctional D-glycero-beta-D-manno-heptose-7-phosphate kinase/D-glycero-beta-D-manno-heptose 1-phosphate adenylyltransferase HldE [Allopseudospirillum japonicum]SEI88434.1 D-beta-D-heptose 7-phosphate kinase / D-beta-D-heptose 1-phosphate adenosyltransferase [Allopseudospirillum japonicum]